MKASVLYNSHSGTTKLYAREIGKYLEAKKISTKVESITLYDRDFLEDADVVLLGSWTSGLMFFAQHPDGFWKGFTSKMPSIKGKPLALFTTYKIATGSMFRKMSAPLQEKADPALIFLKSRNSTINEKNRAQLESLLEDLLSPPLSQRG